MRNDKKKGFTLLELLIALALSAIVLVAMSSFFLANYRTINKTHVKSELQGESENIMVFMSKAFMEGSYIGDIKYTDGYFINYVKINLDDTEYYTFMLDGQTLMYGKNSPPTRKIGENVYKLKVQPFPESNTDLKNVKEVDIELTLQKKDGEYSVKDHIVLRNSEK